MSGRESLLLEALGCCKGGVDGAIRYEDLCLAVEVIREVRGYGNEICGGQEDLQSERAGRREAG